MTRKPTGTPRPRVVHARDDFTPDRARCRFGLRVSDETLSTDARKITCGHCRNVLGLDGPTQQPDMINADGTIVDFKYGSRPVP